MIKISNLEKQFGKLSVLRRINLQLDNPGITTILGPNGSGKTTLLKCFLGMVLPTAGHIWFKDHSVHKGHTYRNDIAQVSQIIHFPDNLTPQELIRMSKDLRPGNTREAQFIEMFGLQKEMGKKMSTLSGGNRQKVNLMLGLMHDKPIMILDEPSNGLDPVAFLNLKTFLKEEALREKLILITTHTISFVEEIAKHVVFLLDGQVYFHGRLNDLIEHEESENLENAIARIVQVKQRSVG